MKKFKINGFFSFLQDLRTDKSFKAHEGEVTDIDASSSGDEVGYFLASVY